MKDLRLDIKQQTKKDIKEHRGKMFMLGTFPYLIAIVGSILLAWLGSKSLIETMSKTDSATMQSAGVDLPGWMQFGMFVLTIITTCMSLGAMWSYQDYVNGKVELEEINVGASYLRVFKERLGRSILTYIITSIISFVVSFVVIIGGVFLFLAASGHAMIFTGSSFMSDSLDEMWAANHVLSSALLVIGFYLLLVLIIALILLQFNLVPAILNYKKDLGSWGVIKYSFRAIKKHRFETIILFLSLLGWFLLTIIPIVGVFVALWFTGAYFILMPVRFYNALVAEVEGPDDSPATHE